MFKYNWQLEISPLVLIDIAPTLKAGYIREVKNEQAIKSKIVNLAN